jgi:hypothetical protein
MAEEQPAGTPAETARREAARQAVILAFGIVTIVIYTWGQRHLAKPDSARSVKMSVARNGERAYARLAAWSWKRAEAFRQAYEGERQ